MTINDLALLNRSRAQTRAFLASEIRRRRILGAALSLSALILIILTMRGLA